MHTNTVTYLHIDTCAHKYIAGIYTHLDIPSHTRHRQNTL